MASDRSGQIVLSKLNYLHDSWTGQESSGWTATTIQDVWGGLRPTHGRWHLAHDDFYGAACTMLTSPTADVSGNSAVKFTRRLWTGTEGPSEKPNSMLSRWEILGIARLSCIFMAGIARASNSA